MRNLFARTALAAFCLTYTGCGSSTDEPDEVVVDPGPPAGADPAWDAVKPVVARACGKCHNGVVHPLDFSKKAVFKGSKAAARISDGTMPPAGNLLAAADKKALLEYLQ